MPIARVIALPLAVSAVVASIAKQVFATEACLLQHETHGMRETMLLREDLEHARSQLASTRVSKSAKIAPHVHPIVNRIGPIPGGKTAPTASGKTSRVDRAPKPTPKSPRPPSTSITTSTTMTPYWNETIPDFGDDETVANQIELSIKPTLEEINLGPNGPLDNFSATFKDEILVAMELPPERMAGLRMNDQAENEGARIDFEVIAGRPSAGRSVTKLAVQLRDQRSRLMNGTLKKILFGAVMVVTQGSQSNHPTITWEEKDRPKNSIIKQIEMKLGVPWAICVVFLAIVAIAIAYCIRNRLK